MATTRSKKRPKRLRLDYEREMLDEGHDLVAGMDEVGRGAWAGPLFVGVVVIDRTTGEAPPGTRDSKQLTPADRRELRSLLISWCAAWAIGRASAREIDALGLTAAQRVASRRALRALPTHPSCVIVDGPIDFIRCGTTTRRVHGHDVDVHPIVRADDLHPSVAAASVLAKVARDELMTRLARRLPDYGFDQHKGYGTPAHAAAIAEHGLSPEHRSTWVFADRLDPVVGVAGVTGGDAASLGDFCD